MIPQRPTPPAYINPNDYTGDEIQWIEDQRAHEHAVAKRAVDALRVVEPVLDFVGMHDEEIDFKQWRAARVLVVNALREIEQSGWEP